MTEGKRWGLKERGEETGRREGGEREVVGRNKKEFAEWPEGSEEI